MADTAVIDLSIRFFILNSFPFFIILVILSFIRFFTAITPIA